MSHLKLSRVLEIPCKIFEIVTNVVSLKELLLSVRKMRRMETAMKEENCMVVFIPFQSVSRAYSILYYCIASST